jgi:DNA-binding IclR family transcriptional regulator
MNKNNKNGIQVIARAATILRLLKTSQSGLSLGQIATQVDLPRSTVQRIVIFLLIINL